MPENIEKLLPVNHYKLQSDANRAAQKVFIHNWMENNKNNEIAGTVIIVISHDCSLFKEILLEISRDEWHGPASPRQPAESSSATRKIVGGALYPSCVPCAISNIPCTWSEPIITTRMLTLASEGLRCENCCKMDADCEFIWSLLDPLRKVEDATNRLLRHAASEYRKLERRTEENESNRERFLEALNKLV